MREKIEENFKVWESFGSLNVELLTQTDALRHRTKVVPSQQKHLESRWNFVAPFDFTLV